MPEEQLIQCSNIAFDEIERIHARLSFHDEKSELSQLNIALLSSPEQGFSMSGDLAAVLTLAEDLHQKTSGYYDISIAASHALSKKLPNYLLTNTLATSVKLGNFEHISITNNVISSSKPVYIDLGGIAKGYAVDQAISTLPQNVTGSINAGGDMRMINWQTQPVSIKYARRNSALKKMTMLNSALATSASYYQAEGSQFFNTKTNSCIQTRGSVSVFADCAMLADALTKVALLMPRKAARKVLQEFNAQAIFINRFGFTRRLT